jgi:type 1 fimbria pilin
MNKRIILISTIAILGSLFLGQAVYAASSTLSVIPSTGSKNVGTTFSTSVQIDPQGNKICVVKGTVSFNNLTCRNITIASGLIAQATPTCASPNFTIGITKCTTAVKNLFSISVKGTKEGQGTISIFGLRL